MILGNEKIRVYKDKLNQLSKTLKGTDITSPLIKMRILKYYLIAEKQLIKAGVDAHYDKVMADLNNPNMNIDGFCSNIDKSTTLINKKFKEIKIISKFHPIGAIATFYNDNIIDKIIK